MNRILSFTLFGAALGVLGGCPIYSSDSTGHRACNDYDGCYECPDGTYSSDCGPSPCDSSYSCAPGEVCNASGYCVSGVDSGGCASPQQCGAGTTCGADGQCDPGDCSTNGCVAGFVCELSGGSLRCVATGSAADGGGGITTSEDAGDAASPAPACQVNTDCPSGDLCLDGTCVPPANQCYDGSQCPTGDDCVQGACTPTCSLPSDAGAAASCPTGYACASIVDASSGGVCTVNPQPCESNPAACPSGTVCTQNHCAATCGQDGLCPAGEECLQGGCVPDQLPLFTCTTDGVQDACTTGSICLHHRCYIACNIDAGATACQSADQFNVCKPVTTTSGTYDVCGSATSLGTECDPTSGKACSSGGICIDGYCY